MFCVTCPPPTHWIHRAVRRKTSLVWLMLCVLVAGCGGSRDESAPTGATSDAQSDLGPTTPPTNPAAQSLTSEAVSEADATTQAGVAVNRADRSATPPADSALETPFSIANEQQAASAADPGERPLRPDLTPQQLLKYLADADGDMQLIASGRAGITDQQEALAKMRRIVRLKLEASRRLRDHSDSDPSTRDEGTRGELQSLSHLAGLGDLQAAIELEKLAETNLKSDDARLVADSRMVLIGFAIESLQNGEATAPQRIATLVNDLASSGSPPDVSAMMVMGQARQVLAQYGHREEAKQIRDAIIRLYGDASDPQIAKMAAQLAGNVEYDQIDRLLQQAIEGEVVDPETWSAAVQKLVIESADLQTVQYLAGAALQFEGLEQESLAAATYQKLAENFTDGDSATGREANLAIEAKRAREAVIGTSFATDAPSVDGSKLSVDDHRGKLVLMPFWAIGFPESLQLIPSLQAIADESPDQIAIVGVNLDRAEAPVSEFVEQNQLEFPSFRVESSATAEVANPLAAEFGMVSAPFIVVLDEEGTVASIDYTLDQVKKTILELRQ
ncbi:TlpA family protein disulfide reductase [Novipirellula artificiosorum]|uniref:Thiol-disulfide oxidoreductase n=1 Tax=Novipirellula artificiosorum TaxID=2528016 RepID=A0A5C6DZE8_9BACT|nr:TlpA disulfide reductase family protein [Novipirellula artificiosorum]TWU42010.1 thiol-disulfide oxidoreductase [Novipirellula artificiosorum]